MTVTTETSQISGVAQARERDPNQVLWLQVVRSRAWSMPIIYYQPPVGGKESCNAC